MPEISALSLAASFLYLVVSVSCLLAMLVARGSGQLGWHVLGWFALAVLFALLMFSRTLDLEATLQDGLREALRESHAYRERRDFQRPMVASLLVIVSAGVFGATYWLAQTVRVSRGRRSNAVLLAAAGAIAMVILICIRMISLSPVDKLLYGPLKLNWVGDVGISVAVLAASLFYIRVVRGFWLSKP